MVVNVRQRIADIESKRNAMSDDLKRLVDLVWSHRKDHTTGTYSAKNVDVYGLYTRAHKITGISNAHMTAFLVRILAMNQLPEIQCSPVKKSDKLGRHLAKKFNAMRAPSGFALLGRQNFINLYNAALKHKNLCKALSNTFYHFRRNLNNSTERVYLHTKPLEAINVMNFVLTQMVLRPNAHPGLSNAKVAAPNPEARFDTIVIYLSDAAALNTALSEIATYQQGGNRHRFDHGVPRSIKEVRNHNGIELIGVGTGAEPPVALNRNKQDLLLEPGFSSFGSYRSELIEFALENTLRRNEGKPQFINRVADYFKAAGIDPREPHAHTNPPELIYRANQTLSQLEKGLEPTWKIS